MCDMEGPVVGCIASRLVKGMLSHLIGCMKIPKIGHHHFCTGLIIPRPSSVGAYLGTFLPLSFELKGLQVATEIAVR
jgi:hypothetical protein